MATHPIIIDLQRTIEINLGDNTVEVNLGDNTVEINQISGGTSNFVESDIPFAYNGSGGDVKIIHNSSDNTIEFYIDGVLSGVIRKGAGGDPFA